MLRKYYRAILAFFRRFRKRKATPLPNAGYVYAPYVPMQVTPTFLKPEDFAVRKGVMTGYGKKLIRSDFYGTVNVSTGKAEKK